MRMRSAYLTPMIAAAGATTAILLAPAAAAQPDCTAVGGTTECSTPGNVQINASPPASEFTLPYWDEVWGGAYTGGPYPVPYAEGSGDLGGGGRR
jgi:hypothetical protein